MTYEDLKKAADEMGYKLTKKKPYIRLEKHCETLPHEWFHAGPKIEYYYECPVCGIKCEEQETERLAKTVWNLLCREGE